MMMWDEAAIMAAWAAWQDEPMRDPATLTALRAYHPLIVAKQADAAFVVAQLGQSLDGRIATPTGHSHYINGPVALDHLHRLRALVDAVVVGASTVMADNPQLSVRRVNGTCPARIVIDPSARTAQTAKWRQASNQRRILIHRHGVHPDDCGQQCEYLPIQPDDDGNLAISDIISALSALGLKRLLIEGGANTVSRWLEAKAIDRLHLLVGPLLIGAGPTGITASSPIETLDQATRPTSINHYPMPGGDLLIDCGF